MVHQLNIFLLLFGALQGWLLSIWFLRNQKKEISNFYIAMLLFIVGLQLTSKVISKMWLMDHAYVFYVLSYKLPYLVGPILFLYCKSRHHKIKITDLLHLSPFFVLASYGWLGWRLLQINIFLHPYADAVLQIISLCMYSYLSIRISKKTKPFILAVVTAEVIISITLALMVVYYGRFPDVRLLFVVLTVLIYWITWRLISRAHFLIETDMPIPAMNLQRHSKYAHSSLKTEEADRIEQDLQRLMAHDKVYLDPSVTIDTLSEKLSTTRHNLSQVINERLRKTYSDYINDFRLEESRQRLSNPVNFRFTIAAIAEDSGFSSVSNFNDVFKKRYGITPSKFRQQHLKNATA